MEQAEPVRTSDGATRSQHVVYVLPHTSEALTQVLTPSLERITPGASETQLLIVTPDAETAVIVSELVYQSVGPQGIEVIAVTSANRAARLMGARPVHAVAGPAPELHTLVQRSVLGLGDIRTVVLAGVDDILKQGRDTVAALEALFAEIPKEAGRIFVTRQLNAGTEQLIERYARNARRILPPPEPRTQGEAGPEQLTIHYVMVTPSSRLITLRRLLDDADPPSAAVVAHSAEAEGEVRRALRQLGYRRENDPVRMTRGPVEPGTHTVVLFEVPQSRSELAEVGSVGVVQTIALVTPPQLETMRTFAGPLVPFTLRTAGSAARQSDRLLREELAAVLGAGAARGVVLREALALEPLLDQYDALEIAAAAVRLLERERERHRGAHPAPGTGDATASFPKGDLSGGDHTPEQRPERRAGSRRPGRPGQDFSDRPKRDFGGDRKRSVGTASRHGERPERDSGQRPKRSPGDRAQRDYSDRPERDVGDRRRRNFGRGPRER